MFNKQILTAKTLTLCCLSAFSICIKAADNSHSDHPGEPSRGVITDYRELTPDENTIQAALDRYGEAMEKKSVEIMEQAVYPKEFTTIESGYPNWSWEDFRDHHLLAEMQSFTDIDYQLGLIEGELDAGIGYAVFSYTAGGKLGDRTVSISGLGTAVLANTESGWRIRHLHTSAPRTQLEAAAGSTSPDH